MSFECCTNPNPLTDVLTTRFSHCHHWGGLKDPTGSVCPLSRMILSIEEFQATFLLTTVVPLTHTHTQEHTHKIKAHSSTTTLLSVLGQNVLAITCDGEKNGRWSNRENRLKSRPNRLYSKKSTNPCPLDFSDNYSLRNKGRQTHKILLLLTQVFRRGSTSCRRQSRRQRQQ